MREKQLDTQTVIALAAAAEGTASDSFAELLQVYDAEGSLIGLAPRLLCHRLGLIHKVVYCFVGDSQGRLLLQTRKGGRLDVSVGGHLNQDDTSPEQAIVREVREEIGVSVVPGRITKITEYLRYSSDRLSKPREINNEWRVLYHLLLSDEERERLAETFEQREDKPSILSIEWFDLEHVVRACDLDKAADGLSASIAHYLLWLLKQGKPHRGK